MGSDPLTLWHERKARCVWDESQARVRIEADSVILHEEEVPSAAAAVARSRELFLYFRLLDEAESLALIEAARGR